MRRFFAPTENFNAGNVTLGLDETRHIRDVLRLRIGDKIAIFDGTGNEFLTRIESIDKKETRLKVIKSLPPAAPESPLQIILAVALLKGDKFDLVIQKAVELGVSKFIPLTTKRCDVKIKEGDKKLDRWQKIILEASKQCGRAKLLEIQIPIPFDQFLQNTKPENSILFSERNGGKFSSIDKSSEVALIIGPEGGWDDSELDLAEKSGVRIVTLGGRILRAETAAIAIPALLQNHFGDIN